MLTPDLLAFVRAVLPAPPSHLLEIGAGQGELAATLDAAGYQVTAIDPAAEDESHVQRATLLDVHGNFDAALAVVALHHVEPLEASCAHLAGLTPYFALGGGARARPLPAPLEPRAGTPGRRGTPHRHRPTTRHGRPADRNATPHVGGSNGCHGPVRPRSPSSSDAAQ